MGGLAGFVQKYDELMLDPRMSEIYGASRYFNVGYWLPDTQDQANACENLIERVLRPVPNTCARLLDVGCGQGASTQAIQRRFPAAHVVGINISHRQLQGCRDAARPGGYAVVDAARLAFRDQSFDAVVSVEAAFHFRTRNVFLGEARRVLRPGGWLVMSDILFSSTGWVGEWMVPTENAVSSLDAYRHGLERLGFTHVELVDCTTRSWSAFCIARIDCTRRQCAAGQLEARTAASQLRYLDRLLHDTVRHYLLVSARKEVRA